MNKQLDELKKLVRQQRKDIDKNLEARGMKKSWLEIITEAR